MPHAPFRLLRTALLGSTVLGLAAGAHLLAGGTLPAPLIMVAILALHILLTALATKFRLTLPTMAALLGSSQLALHHCFDTLSHGAHLAGAAGTVGASDPTAVSHHLMSSEAHASAVMAQAASLAPLDALGMSAHAMPAWMWAAHIAASLAAAGLLAYGENALWSLANWLRPLYRCAAVVLLLPAPRVRSVMNLRPLPRLPWRNLRPDTRRGPPLSSANFA